MGKKVKIIMNHDVLNIGEEGDIRDVAPGYARNYLFPRKLAVPYNDHTITILGQKRRKIEKRKEEKKVLAHDIKEKLLKEEIVFNLSAGENGKLFGSITNGHIAEELQKRGYTIERKKIEVPDHHLKSTGDYSIKVKLYGDEEAILKVSVKPLEVKNEATGEKKEKTNKGDKQKLQNNADVVTDTSSEVDAHNPNSDNVTMTEENAIGSAGKSDKNE